MKPFALFLSAALALQLHAAPTIGTVRVSQTTAIIGAPTQVTVEASITDPTLITGGANLLQINSNGTTTILGALHDDGLNGDHFGGDLVFTLVVTLNSPVASQVQLQVSAAFKGVLARVKSSTMSVFFQPANAPQQALASLSQALASGNITSALTFINPSSNSVAAISSFGQQSLNFLASALNAATLVSSGPDSRIFQSPFTAADGTTTQLEFEMVPNNGQWIINNW